MKRAALLSIPLLMSACASSPTMEQVARDRAKSEEVRTQASADLAAKKQTQNEALLEQIPRWALQAPIPDASGVYAVGIGKSSDLRTSMRKAMLDGEFGLAKLYNQELSGSERSYNQEQGGALTQQYTELIDKLVTQVPVVGLETIKQDVKSIGGEFNTFVLVKLPYTEFNRVLQQQKSQAHDAKIAAAFSDLERRVSERQAQRAKEARDAQTATLAASVPATASSAAEGGN